MGRNFSACFRCTVSLNRGSSLVIKMAMSCSDVYGEKCVVLTPAIPWMSTWDEVDVRVWVFAMEMMRRQDGWALATEKIEAIDCGDEAI